MKTSALLAAGILLFSGTFPNLGLASSGTRGAAFLDIPVGGGPAALGGAYSALATNAYAPVWNPGGLGFLSSTQLAALHVSYLESLHYEFASVAVPFGSGRGLAVSGQYLGTGDMTRTNPAGQAIGEFSNHYGAYTLAYGQTFWREDLALGFAFKAIEAKLDREEATAFAGDAGVHWQAREDLSMGLTVTNVGSQLNFIDEGDSLPTATHVGIAYQPHRAWQLSAEGVYRWDAVSSGHAGVQWRPVRPVAIRAGFRSDTRKELSSLAGFTTGIGIELGGQEFAYAWVPFDDLGSVHYFSALLRFGGGKP